MRSQIRLALTAAGLLLFAGSVSAQGKVEVLQERLEQKTKKKFIGNAAWEQDYDKARASSVSSGKLIFVYFTRSHTP